MLTLFVLASAFIILADGVELVQQRRWRELGVMGFLLGLAGFIAVSGSLHLPTPIDGLQQMLRPVGETLFKFHG